MTQYPLTVFFDGACQICARETRAFASLHDPPPVSFMLQTRCL